MRRTYRATLAYDGSRYCGFSMQRGERTVEGVILEALQPLLPRVQRVACGGRTDRGVHATGQVVSFHTRVALSNDELFEALDGADPDALAVRELATVPNHFHASFSAVGRRYAYLHEDGGTLEVDRADAMLAELAGTRCFAAFARDTPSGASTVRRLYAAGARRIAPDRVRFDFHANGFLRRQVRVMVATALREAALGAGPDALVSIALAGDRRSTAPAADAGGLYLVAVDYPPF
jgi:tRNA pseudouridine38-40 synthase